MGAGDVHLMGAVGAAFGWIDPIIAFFLAPFFGLAWVLVSATGGRFCAASPESFLRPASRTGRGDRRPDETGAARSRGGGFPDSSPADGPGCTNPFQRVNEAVHDG